MPLCPQCNMPVVPDESSPDKYLCHNCKIKIPASKVISGNNRGSQAVSSSQPQQVPAQSQMPPQPSQYQAPPMPEEQPFGRGFSMPDINPKKAINRIAATIQEKTDDGAVDTSYKPPVQDTDTGIVNSSYAPPAMEADTGAVGNSYVAPAPDTMPQTGSAFVPAQSPTQASPYHEVQPQAAPQSSSYEDPQPSSPTLAVENYTPNLSGGKKGPKTREYDPFVAEQDVQQAHSTGRESLDYTPVRKFDNTFEPGRGGGIATFILGAAALGLSFLRGWNLVIVGPICLIVIVMFVITLIRRIRGASLGLIPALLGLGMAIAAVFLTFSVSFAGAISNGPANLSIAFNSESKTIEATSDAGNIDLVHSTPEEVAAYMNQTVQTGLEDAAGGNAGEGRPLEGDVPAAEAPQQENAPVIENIEPQSEGQNPR